MSVHHPSLNHPKQVPKEPSFSVRAAASSLPKQYGDAILSWQAPEHEPLELGPRAKIIVTVLLIAIISYALYTNSPLMAIVFILIGVVGYLLMHRSQQILDFHITTKGIAAGNSFYELGTIESFHIYTEPPFEGLLSIKTTGKLVPYAHIPIMTVDTESLRQLLARAIPEDIHEPGLVDTLEKLLHI